VVVVVGGTEADFLSGGGGGGRNGETTRNGEMAQARPRGRMQWQDQERKNEMARPREEE